MSMGDALGAHRGTASSLMLRSVTVHHRGAPTAALDGVDLTLADRTLGVVGCSGAGKSTLVRVALGLQRPDAGSVTWQGAPLPRDRAGRRTWRRSVQYVPQDPGGSLDPRHRVGRIVAEPLRRLRVPGNHRALVADALDRAGLDHRLIAQRAAHLSGGQAQRVAIARALATGARVIVADEPLSSLDPGLRDDLIAVLARLRAEQGLGLLLVSHDLDAVRRLCEHTAVLHDGRIVEEGPTADVLTTPSSDAARLLLAAELPQATGVLGDLPATTH